MQRFSRNRCRRKFGRVTDCVEFMVAHDDPGAAAVDHASDDLEHAQLLTAAVDEVADGDRLALWMAEGARAIVIAPQRLQS